jgi:NitT/TauT family transport system substrate-binding protein
MKPAIQQWTKRWVLKSSVLAVAALAGMIGPASAEVTEIRMSRQPGLPYLPMMVIEDQKLIEKHAKAAGLGDVKVTWVTLSNSTAMMDSLFAGQLDFVGPGVPTLATLWDKTVGTANEVKAVSAMQSMPYILVSRNPAVKTIADLTDKDRVAIPAPKITGHALSLEMEAAKLWGFDKYNKLDSLQIQRSHPDAAAAMMSNAGEINHHFASSPYYYYMLAKPGFRAILKSYDVVGGKHTNGVLIATKKFYDANPKATAAVLAAQNEANAFIKANVRKAAELYMSVSKEKDTTVDELEKMVADPDVEYTTTPANTMAFAEFMHKVGRLKKKPESWKDMFFPTAHDLKGS